MGSLWEALLLSAFLCSCILCKVTSTLASMENGVWMAGGQICCTSMGISEYHAAGAAALSVSTGFSSVVFDAG
jgi:hypothetical protein